MSLAENLHFRKSESIAFDRQTQIWAKPKTLYKQKEQTRKTKNYSLIEKYSYLEKSDHPAKMADYLKMWKELQASEVAETTYDGYHTYIDRDTLFPISKI